MKSIFLVRHAKAEDRKEEITDFSRSLVKQGEKDACEIGRKIKDKISGSVIFISSPANRALETAHIFAEKLNYPIAKILVKDEVYGQSPEHLMNLIKKSKDTYKTIILFGHNPVISDLASLMIKMEFEFNIPKSGILGFEFSQNSWGKIEKHTGFLKCIEYPAQKSEKINEFQNILSKKISQAISELLNEANPEISKNILESVESHAYKLAKIFTKNLRQKTNEKSVHK